MTPRHAVFVSCAIVALAASATARADELPYSFTDTLVGSMIPQEIIRSPLPFDGRYADLTAAQKATLANEYESLPAGDEPPYPQYGLRHLVAPMVRYADLATPVGAWSPAWWSIRRATPAR